MKTMSKIIFIGFSALFFFVYSTNVNAATLYWNTIGSGGDYSWNNLNNWWTDQDQTLQAESLPQADDTVIFDDGQAMEVDVDDWVAPQSIDGQDSVQIIFSSSADGVVNTELIDIEPLFQGSTVFEGSISGSNTASFYENSVNKGTVSGPTYFFDSSQNHALGQINNNAEFSQSSVNYGQISGDVLFQDDSINDSEESINPDSVTFSGSAINQGLIEAGGNVVFNDDSLNEGVIETEGTVTFNGFSLNTGVVSATGNTSFSNPVSTTVSANADGQVVNHAIFSGTFSINADFGETGSKEIGGFTLSGSDVWSNQVTYTEVTSWDFSGSSSNQGTILGAETLTFQDSAFNNGSIQTDEINFFDDSENRGSIETETALFQENTENTSTGSINASDTITFYDDLSDNYGTLSASTKKRQYSATTTTTRNFISDGPWTVIANGVLVNYCSAKYTSRTEFLAINGGSFAPCSQGGNGNGGGNKRPQLMNQNLIIVNENEKKQINEIIQKIEILKKKIEILEKNNSTLQKINTFNFPRNLQLGDLGDDVFQLQTYLQNNNFFPVDYKKTDYFGKQTYQALVEFQASVGLPSTGFFGLETRNYINKNIHQ